MLHCRGGKAWLPVSCLIITHKWFLRLWKQANAVTVKCSSNRIYTSAVHCDFQLSKKIPGFNFTFFTKNYYHWAPNVVPLILCCRLKLNNRAIKIIVHIRTLFARHHPDWKNIALCSLNIKQKEINLRLLFY